MKRHISDGTADRDGKRKRFCTWPRRPREVLTGRMDAEGIWHVLDGTPLRTCGGADPNSYDKEQSSCQACSQEPYPGRSQSSSEAIDVELGLYPWLTMDQHSVHHWSFKTLVSRPSLSCCVFLMMRAWSSSGKSGQLWVRPMGHGHAESMTDETQRSHGSRIQDPTRSALGAGIDLIWSDVTGCERTDRALADVTKRGV